jgi:hypothetical protein
LQTTDAQVRKLMKEIRKTGKNGDSALRSWMSRNTAAKYVKIGKLPSELTEPRTWRTCVNLRGTPPGNILRLLIESCNNPACMIRKDLPYFWTS